MTSSSIAITAPAAIPERTSRARLGPVSTPSGWPGNSSPITSVMRLPVLSSNPLARLITGTHGRISGRIAAAVSRIACEGTPSTTTSASLTASAISLHERSAGVSLRSPR